MTILKTKEEVESLLIKLHGSADQELVKTLWGAVSRNIRPGGRDSKYWDDGATGYQTCPLTGMRKARFDSRTVAVLGLTYDAYVKYLTDNNLPIPAKTNGFMDEVNAKLKEVDPSTGKSKRDLLNEKARETLLRVGEDGLTGDERRGRKTQAGLLEKTHDGRTVAAVAAQARNDVIMEDGRTLQQHAVEKAVQTQIANGTFGGNISKQSLNALAPIIKLLNENNISYYSNESEYAVVYAVNIEEGKWPLSSIGKHKAILGKTLYKSKEEASKYIKPGEITQAGTFKYDLVIPSFNLNIEFNGLNVHPDPAMSKDDWNRWSFSQKGETINADQKSAYDKIKLNWLLSSRNISSVEIWGPDGDVSGCIDLIKACIETQ